MDLQDVLKKAVEGVDEANKAFHAGHHEDAESFLEGVNDYMTLYFGEAPPRPDRVTESANGDKPDTGLAEKPDQAQAPEASKAQPASQFLGANVGRTDQDSPPPE